MSVGSSAPEASVSNAIELRLVKDRWVLTGDPYALFRAEKAIPFSDKLPGGGLSFPATEETAIELMWLKQRFPFHCRHEMVLRKDAAKCNQRQLEARRIMAGKYEPGCVAFREGLQPREYQTQGAMLWRATRDLLCADEVGVGKTVTALAGLADAKMLPAVVVCPSNLTHQWQSQIERFLPSLTTHRLSTQKVYDLRVIATCMNCGEAATRTAAVLQKCTYCKHGHFKRSLADIFLISYTLAQYWALDLAQFVKSVVYDECQEIRRSESAKYAACKRISDKAVFHLGCSATPVHNFGGEMWNILNVVCPGRLGDRSHFREQWCGYSEQGKEPPLKDPEAFSVYLKSQGMMIRRTRKDVGRELPLEQRIVHEIDFKTEVFDKMTKDAKELARVIVRLNDTQVVKGDEFTAAGRFRTMVYKATGVAKAPYVAKFVEMLMEAGEPVMLFGWHRDVYAIWERELRQHNPLFYTGHETPKVKEQNKQAFISGRSKLLICSLKSGVGLDGIQDYCRVGVFGELDWSPAVITQCVGRYHRDGQKEPCLTYMMLSDGGLDPYMVQTLGIKKLQVDGVVEQKDPTSVLDSLETAKHLRDLAQKFLAA